MRRLSALALLPLLSLAACCSSGKLSTAPDANFPENSSSGSGGGSGTSGEASSGNGSGSSSGFVQGDGGTDGGWYTPPGKAPDCQPLDNPVPCAQSADCGNPSGSLDKGEQICLARGCQPAECAQCGLAGQPDCPFPLQCQAGTCVAMPPGSSSGGGSSGTGSSGTGSSGNSSGGSSGNSSGGSGNSSSGTSGNSSSGVSGSSGSGTSGNSSSGVSGSSSSGTSGNSSSGVSGSSGSGTSGNSSSGVSGSSSSGTSGNSSSGVSGSSGSGTSGNSSSGVSGSSGSSSSSSGGSGSSGASSGSSGASGGSGGSGSSGASSGSSGASSGSGGSGSSGASSGSSSGNVQPDGGACQTDPDLNGGWSMNQDYELGKALASALGTVVQAANDIDQLLQLLQVLGAPIPSWATTLLNDLLNLEYLLSQLDVTGTLQLAGAPMSYTATETWQSIVLATPQGGQIGLAPDQDGGSGNFYFTSPPPYSVTTCSGIAIFHKHRLDGALKGILPPLLDAVTQLATNGQYNTFQDAIKALLDCNQFTSTDAGPPPVPAELGSSCSQDSDCTACEPALGSICDQATCQPGCRNQYDCGAGFFCDAQDGGLPQCSKAYYTGASTTQVSGKLDSSCQTDSDCNGGQTGTGVYCQPTSDGDGGIEQLPDGGLVGSCAAGCNLVDNLACAQGDICDNAPGDSKFGKCQTNDTSVGNASPVNQTQSGCAGPGGGFPDAGFVAGPGTILCQHVSDLLLAELTKFLDNLVFNVGVAQVQGQCTVQDANDLTNGVWTGDMLFLPIGGHFQATRTSGP